MPTSPKKSPLAKVVYAPLGDGELTPKPLTFAATEKEEKGAASGKNIFSSFFAGKTGRLGDDYAPQEPLQVFMAVSGDEDEGEKKDGETKGMYPFSFPL